MAQPPLRRTLGLVGLLFLGATTSLVCSPVQPGAPAAAPPASPPSLLVHIAPATTGALAFPPADDDRRPRAPLPEGLAAGGRTTALTVTAPSLDGDRKFSIVGSTLQIAFNQTMARGDAAKAVKGQGIPADGLVKITPEVPGSARWIDDRTIEFTAAQPLDPTTNYAIEVAGVASAGGGKLDAPWKASFTSRPGTVIAGKEIGYLPVRGEPRVIAMHPGEYEKIGRTPTFSVLYDQPIDPALARSLIELRDEEGRRIATSLSRPQGPTFQGVKVDPRYVVLIRPNLPLPSGKSVNLFAGDKSDLAGRRRASSVPLGRKRSLTVADPLVFTGIGCGYGYSDHDAGCVVSEGQVRTDSRTVNVRFNNPIGEDGDALARRVTVVPKVKNLYVSESGWSDGRLVLSGLFEASTTYDVTVAGLVDRYGNAQSAPVRFKIEKAPESTSAAMPEGLLLLDEATTKRFAITTRNLAEAELLAWPVPAGDAEKLQEAMAKVRARTVPVEDPPVRIAVPVKAERDRSVTTEVDLGAKLASTQSWIVTLRGAKPAFGAEPPRYPSWSEAAKPPVALIRPGSPKALRAHVREHANTTLVQVARLESGEPVAGATVAVRGREGATATTDAQGVAALPGTLDSESAWIEVRAADAELLVPPGGSGAAQLFPALTAGEAPASAAERAMVLTDRGIYRPGSTVWIKANVRRQEGDRLAAAKGMALRVRVVGPTGDEAFTEDAVASERGAVATRFEVPKDAKLGRYQLRIERAENKDDVLAETMVQIAEFEPPRFAVDVDAAVEDAAKGARGKAQGGTFRANVRGRYLFGAPMDGAAVRWTLKRRAAPFPAGPLTDELTFRKRRSWYDEDDDGPTWSRGGEGKLAADGTFKVEHALEIDAGLGPQEFTLEADVTDTSYRHVAGRASVVRHGAPRYAGLKIASGWIGVNEPFPVTLGVIDTGGQPVVGASVVAKLEHVDWKYIRRRGAGGALRWDWVATRREVGRCTATSASQPAACSLSAPRSGDYEITALVDGKPGGVRSIWAWRDGGEASAFPSRGRVVEIVPDKARYRPGEKAKLLVKSPYASATALLTIEQGGLIEHRSARVTGGSAVFDVALGAAHAPWVHAAVTLLPIGAKGEAIADYRVGAARLPVALENAKLELALKSAKEAYEPGQEAEIAIEVKDGGKPEPRAEIAVAVVDEGVLRLTDFHAPDPVTALHPGRALAFRLRDSRQTLADLFERSHVAGDGGGAGRETIASTRKNFVETAFWKPDVVTDEGGRATVRFKLPDNLTQFRIMAVALDDEGRGARAESSFTVRKPVMLAPVVPRFASVGDHLEVAAMLHNNTSDSVAAKVRLGATEVAVTVPGGGKSRVGFPISAAKPGEMTLAFAVETNGAVLDRVEQKLRVDEPGLDEHPRLAGAFVASQEIDLDVPDDVRAREGEDAVSVQVGQHLWPELGRRLDYLLDYPHGCVEQTTSSTLPLLAARTILPRIGMSRLSDAELVTRIRAGLERLASMRTEGGGLAYWPGGSEPNVYGTAYAMRAVVLAEKAGVAGPKGLLDGMKEYLGGELRSASAPPEVLAAIAQSLAEIGALEAGGADALVDKAEEMSVFGKASLALALRALGDEDDRVAKLLDEVEASFDAQGRLTAQPKDNDFYYYGSPTRTTAQAAIALARLRPAARVLPTLLHDLADATESYTTQSTAYSLLALAEQLGGATGEGAKVTALLDGEPLATSKDLGFGSREYRIPLSRLRGKKARLALKSEGSAAVAFLVGGRWRRPLAASGAATATSAPKGPDVYRVFTDPKGGSVDLAKVRAGDVLRVALLVRFPRDIDHDRLGYVAVVDRLPAGFEAVQPDLATVASAPELGDAHAFASVLRWSDDAASHVELRDDRVNLYFDRVWGDEVAATYLVRATTPGEFVAPPASAELMYEGDSTGYSDAAKVVVQ